MTAHAAIAAVPKTAAIDRALLQALLVSRIAYILGDSEDPEAFDPRGEDDSPVTLVIGYRGQFFWFDEADTTAGHDGTTCIVTSVTGGRYKVNNIDLLITSVLSKTVSTPPDPDDLDEEARPSNGDAYIAPVGSTGAWASGVGSIFVWVAARREWFEITPKQGWTVSIAGALRDTRYVYDSVQQDWITGDGGDPGASTIPLSALKAYGLGPLRVQNQTTYAPPGSRKTGATPTMPLGGTASNINDNSDATTATTSSLGDLSAASVSGRIVAQLALAATTDLIAIEARGVLGTAASSSNAMAVYYRSGGVWTQAGAGFTLSTSAQTVRRTGSFAAVTDIALVTEAKAWSTNTHTIAGLNAFDATVSASIGDAYIIAASAFGIFAGKDGQVALCEADNEFSYYSASSGNTVYDVSLGIPVSWNGTAWASSAGSVVFSDSKNTASGSTTVGGSGNRSYSASVAPTTSLANRRDDIYHEHAARKIGAKIKFRYRAFIVPGGDVALYEAGIYKNTDSNALDWIPFLNSTDSAANGHEINLDFEISASDTNSNKYYLRISNSTGAIATVIPDFSRRLFSMDEYA